MPYSLFTEPHHFFYRKQYGRTWFYIRWFRLEQDISVAYRWVNLPYAHKYWQMQGSLPELTQYLIKQKQEAIASTFVVCHGLSPIALFETYQVKKTEVSVAYASKNDDYGIHLLMAPPEELLSLKGKVGSVSESVLVTILEMMFSHSSVSRVVAEPDVNNAHAHRLAEKAGFLFQNIIQLKDKTAKLYMITREQFLKNL